MRAFVVDANVPIVASDRSSHADATCVLACVRALSDIQQSGMIVLDDEMMILREYMTHLNMRGQPGVGDAFFKWVWENQAVPSRCEQVTLVRTTDDPEGFSAFPRDPSLSAFDPSDRKYVAVALASHNSPTVLNAVDTDWWQHRETLAKHGVQIEFLCPQHTHD